MQLHWVCRRRNSWSLLARGTTMVYASCWLRTLTVMWLLHLSPPSLCRTMLSIWVISGGTLTVRNLTFASVKAINRIFSPTMFVPQISPIRVVAPNATCHLIDVTVITPDKQNITGSLSYVDSFTPAHKLNMTVSDDNSVVINSFELHQDEWMCVAPALRTQRGLTYDPVSAWIWTNVTVKSSSGSACGSGGVKVRGGMTEKAALMHVVWMCACGRSPHLSMPDHPSSTTALVRLPFDMLVYCSSGWDGIP